MKNRRSQSEQGHRSQRVGRSGERIVADIFDYQFEWIPRTDSPDNGIDLSVELPQTSTLPISRILVQVKTEEKIKKRADGSWAVSVSPERYSDYLNNRLPVFLVGVDRATQEVRWTYVRDPASLISKSRRGVRFRLLPIARLELKSKATFESIARAASAGLDAKYSDPVAALEHRRLALEATDPRLRVGASIVERQMSFSISAKDNPVTVGLRLAVDPKDKEAFERAVRFGIPHTFEPVELRFHGSPLFETLKLTTLTVGSAPQIRRIQLGYEDATGRIRWPINEDAELYVGQDGGFLKLGVPNLPLRMTVMSYADGRLSFSIGLDFDAKWLGKRISTLPYLDDQTELLKGVLESGHLILGGRVEGLVLELGRFPVADSRPLVSFFYACLVCVQALSSVCRRTGGAHCWRSWTDADVAELHSWLDADALLDRRSIRLPSTELTANGRITGEYRDRVLAAKNPQMLVRHTRMITAWGEPVVDLPLLAHVEGYNLDFSEQGRLRMSPAADGKITVTLDPEPNAEPAYFPRCELADNSSVESAIFEYLQAQDDTDVSESS